MPFLPINLTNKNNIKHYIWVWGIQALLYITVEIRHSLYEGHYGNIY